jgi:hypothetical protein
MSVLAAAELLFIVAIIWTGPFLYNKQMFIECCYCPGCVVMGCRLVLPRVTGNDVNLRDPFVTVAFSDACVNPLPCVTVWRHGYIQAYPTAFKWQRVLESAWSVSELYRPSYRPLSAKLVPTSCRKRASRDQRNRFLWLVFLFPGSQPLLFVPRSSSIVLTGLSGTRSRHMILLKWISINLRTL